MFVSALMRQAAQQVRQVMQRRRHSRKRPIPQTLHLEALESRELLAAGDFRVVTYNIASASGAPRPGLEVVLRAIGDEVHNGRSQPMDLLALQEVQSQATTTQAVVDLLNGIYGPGTYARGSLDGATTGFGTQGVVYRTGTLQLLDEMLVGTSSTNGQPRQAIRHHFHPVGFPAAGDFYVYNSHYDAGDTSDDEASRLAEALAIRADADAFGPEVPILYLGDFNTYTHSEDGYQHLLSPGSAQAFDPLNRPGAWQDRPQFRDIHNQAPAVDPPGTLFGGGIDDRFNHQLITDDLVDGTGLEYRFNTLHPFGHNGTAPLNGNVNDPSNTALAGLSNRLQVLDLLTTLSDHLPLVADYTVNAPSALTVTWLEPARSGFTLHFDRPVDPSPLNLYGSPAQGPADLTVTDFAGNPVRGSLLVTPDARSITFVRTGGVLAGSDTYTITLRSAADGFRDAGGGLLDGDGDGISGDAFTTRFSAPAAAGVVVGAPEFLRGPGQPVHLPANSTAGLPLRLSNGSGITKVELTLQYDPALLTITGATVTSSVPAGARVDFTLLGSGLVGLTFTSTTPLSSGARNFVTLQATVPGSAPYGTKHVLDVASVRINDGAIATRDDDGLHVVGYLGDVTGNARYSSADATRALRVAVGLDGGFPGFRLTDPALVADVNGDGRVSAVDATRILQESLGLDQAPIPPLPANPPVILTPGPDPLLSISRTFRGWSGELVTVPVNLDRSEGVESADLAIAYDARRLEVVEVRRGSLTADFDVMLVNLDASAGTLRVGLGRTAGPLGDQGSGRVLEIVFRIRPNAPAGRAVINLRHGVDSTTTQLNEGGLDLQPGPTDQAGDVLDGWVVVQGPLRHHVPWRPAGRFSGSLRRTWLRPYLPWVP